MKQASSGASRVHRIKGGGSGVCPSLLQGPRRARSGGSSWFVRQRLAYAYGLKAVITAARGPPPRPCPLPTLYGMSCGGELCLWSPCVEPQGVNLPCAYNIGGAAGGWGFVYATRVNFMRGRARDARDTATMPLEIKRRTRGTWHPPGRTRVSSRSRRRRASGRGFRPSPRERRHRRPRPRRRLQGSIEASCGDRDRWGSHTRHAGRNHHTCVAGPPTNCPLAIFASQPSPSQLRCVSAAPRGCSTQVACTSAECICARSQ